MSQDHNKGMHVDIELVRQLAAVLDDTNLTEIEVEDGDRKVRVARTVTAAPAAFAMPAAAPVAAAPATAAAVEAAPLAVASAENAVKSPMVGTAYLSAEPGSKPFVSVGDSVSEGDTILIIEAMKVMNQIPAPKSGKVSRILVQNAEPVEYGQPLVVID